MEMTSIRLPLSVIKTAGLRYGIDAESLDYLYSRDSHDFFSSSCHCKDQIIRISKPDDSDLDAVRAEVHFVQYLGDAGAFVPRVIKSLNDKSFEYFSQNGSQYVAVSFEHHKDQQTSSQLTNGTIRLLGKSVGVIHRISREYQPPVDSWRRPTCTSIAEAMPDLPDKAKKLLHALNSIPRNPITFGLVHGNLVREAISVKPDGLIIHGFEQCCRSWYAYDIAVALHDCVKKAGDTSRRKYSEYFLEMFFRGYDEENTIDDLQLDSIPLFLELLDYTKA